MRASHRLAYRALELWWHVRRPVTVGTLVMMVREGRVVLVRQTYKPGWTLPGGGVQRAETLEEAVRREAMEEAGATLGPLRLWGVYSSFPHGKSDHAAVFLCEDFSLTGRHDHEIEEVRSFALDALPVELGGGAGRRLAELRAGAAPGFGRW